MVTGGVPSLWVLICLHGTILTPLCWAAERAPRVSPALVMSSRRFDLASEDAVADHGVEQHQREDEKALAPEHEGKARMRRGSVVDGDRERDHVWPERDRQRAERRRKHDHDHDKGRRIPATHDARRQADRRKAAEYR